MWKNKEIQEFYQHEFDFDNQHKDTYDDWIRAFTESIRKRATDGCFIGLSSGYDSGAITKELSKQNVNFKVYTMLNNENEKVIDERLKYCPEWQIAEMTTAQWQDYYDFLKDKINPKAMRDIASMGVAYMFETAVKEGRTICISGQGGDEINSDYSLYPGQSHFKGKWPDKLYEWPNFRGHMQEEYLNELEDIAAIYGVEVRYPFLDVDLVQEFLWLKPELKNRNYKATIFEYLTRNNVPFDKEIKRGFNPIPKPTLV